MVWMTYDYILILQRRAFGQNSSRFLRFFFINAAHLFCHVTPLIASVVYMNVSSPNTHHIEQ